MKVRGPLITLAAVAALGVGILTVNISQEPDPVIPGRRWPTTAPAPAPPHLRRLRRRPHPHRHFRPRRTTSARSRRPPAPSPWISRSTATRPSPTPVTATTVESWLRGPAVNGTVSLASKDRTSRLEGHLDGAAIVGTLWIGEKKWDFTAPVAQPPAGCMCTRRAGFAAAGSSTPTGQVTGVLRLYDGSTVPAPGLETDAQCGHRRAHRHRDTGAGRQRCLSLSQPSGSARRGGDAAVLVAVLIGALAAVGLGVFGKVHEPQFFSISVAGFSSGTAVKSWLATVAVTLALFQLVSAFAMYRLIPGGKAPGWIGTAHVWRDGWRCWRACPSRCTACTRWDSSRATTGCCSIRSSAASSTACL